MIYVDCDALVLEDISKLWDKDISPYFAAAVEDAGQHERLKKMNISDEAKYFNSGIMIIDMEAWRKNNISKKSSTSSITTMKTCLCFMTKTR